MCSSDWFIVLAFLAHSLSGNSVICVLPLSHPVNFSFQIYFYFYNFYLVIFLVIYLFSDEKVYLSIHSISVLFVISGLESDCFFLENWSFPPSSLYMKCCWVVSWPLAILCYVGFVSYYNLLNNAFFFFFFFCRQLTQLDSDCISTSSAVGGGSDLNSVFKAFALLLGVYLMHVPLRG